MRTLELRAHALLFGLVATAGCSAPTPRAEPAWSPERPTLRAEPDPSTDASGARAVPEPSSAPARVEPEPEPAPSRVREAFPLPTPRPEEPERAWAEWTVRAWGGVVGRFVETDNETFQDPTFGTSELSWPGTSFGFGVDVERRFSKLLGLDLALGYTNVETEFDHSVGASPQTDDLGVLPIWLALNFHVFDNERFDVYLGPQIAYFIYLNDLSYEVPGVGTYDVQTDNEFPSLGFLIGTDIALGDRWALNFAFRFQDADADSNHLLPLDPTFVTIGVARSF